MKMAASASSWGSTEALINMIKGLTVAQAEMDVMAKAVAESMGKLSSAFEKKPGIKGATPVGVVLDEINGLTAPTKLTMYTTDPVVVYPKEPGFKGNSPLAQTDEINDLIGPPAPMSGDLTASLNEQMDAKILEVLEETQHKPMPGVLITIDWDKVVLPPKPPGGMDDTYMINTYGDEFQKLKHSAQGHPPMAETQALLENPDLYELAKIKGYLKATLQKSSGVKAKAQEALKQWEAAKAQAPVDPAETPSGDWIKQLYFNNPPSSSPKSLTSYTTWDLPDADPLEDLKAAKKIMEGTHYPPAVLHTKDENGNEISIEVKNIEFKPFKFDGPKYKDSVNSAYLDDAITQMKATSEISLGSMYKMHPATLAIMLGLVDMTVLMVGGWEQGKKHILPVDKMQVIDTAHLASAVASVHEITQYKWVASIKPPAGSNISTSVLPVYAPGSVHANDRRLPGMIRQAIIRQGWELPETISISV
jgi:hypothetical protein